MPPSVPQLAISLASVPRGAPCRLRQHQHQRHHQKSAAARQVPQQWAPHSFAAFPLDLNKETSTPALFASTGGSRSGTAMEASRDTALPADQPEPEKDGKLQRTLTSMLANVPNGTVPQHLVDEICAGNCVAFVGAGFSVTAGLPGWATLLEQLVDRAVEGGRWIREDEAQSLKELVAKEKYDQCAQTLEDKMGPGPMARAMAELLDVSDRSKWKSEMEERLRLLAEIPFSAILTTNFDKLLPGVPGNVLPGSLPRVQKDTNEAMRAVLRGSYESSYLGWDSWHWNAYVSAGSLTSPENMLPIIQLHGSTKEEYLEEPGLTFTKAGYRRILHGSATYSSFLSSVMSTKTVLYLGFSFQDEYINELRSSVVQMLGADVERPLAYAITDSKTPLDAAYYLKHEGVQFLNFDPHQGGQHKNWQGFLQRLRDIHDKTSPPKRWAASITRGLSGGTAMQGVFKFCKYKDEKGDTILWKFFKQELPESMVECCPHTAAQGGLEDWLKATLSHQHVDLVITPFRQDLTPSRAQSVALAIQQLPPEHQTRVIVWTADQGGDDVRQKERVRRYRGFVGASYSLTLTVARVSWPQVMRLGVRAVCTEVGHLLTEMREAIHHQRPGTTSDRGLLLQWLAMVPDLDAMFHAIDRDHDGNITLAELRAAVEASVEQWPDAARLPDLVMRFADADANGAIDLDEFKSFAEGLRNVAVPLPQPALLPCPRCGKPRRWLKPDGSFHSFCGKTCAAAASATRALDSSDEEL